MTIPKRFFLAHIYKIGQVRYFTNFLQKFNFPVFFKPCLKFKMFVKMILNPPLVPAGNYNHLLYSRFHCLFNHILDNRFVDNRQHFFGRSFSRRQKPGTKPRRGNNNFSNLVRHLKLQPSRALATEGEFHSNTPIYSVAMSLAQISKLVVRYQYSFLEKERFYGI